MTGNDVTERLRRSDRVLQLIHDAASDGCGGCPRGWAAGVER